MSHSSLRNFRTVNENGKLESGKRGKLNQRVYDIAKSMKSKDPNLKPSTSKKGKNKNDTEKEDGSEIEDVSDDSDDVSVA